MLPGGLPVQPAVEHCMRRGHRKFVETRLRVTVELNHEPSFPGLYAPHFHPFVLSAFLVMVGRSHINHSVVLRTATLPTEFHLIVIGKSSQLINVAFAIERNAILFESHVTHHYEFLGDKLIIGKFCAIAKGVEFIMNGANHRMGGVTTYPFNLFGCGWEKVTPSLQDLPFKGDTVIGNDVWIGQNVTFLPGVHVGDGAIIGANSTVSRDIPPYCVAAGDPARVVRKRYDDETTAFLLELKWWDWPAEKITSNLEALASGDLNKLKSIYNEDRKRKL